MLFEREVADMRWLILCITIVLGLGRFAGAAPEHPAGETATAHPAEHEEPALLPDFSKRETWMSALWVVIIFLVMLAVLYKTAWKNVLKGLKAREERIRNDIAEAEAARARAEATLREYNAQLTAAEGRVRDMLNAATKDGERVATEIRMRAQTEAEDAKKRAMKDIDTARQQALAEIYQRAAELSTSIAEKILRRNINAEDQKDLVKRSLDELQTINR
jgi:F-type H+-transporting ATPase subunit b